MKFEVFVALRYLVPNKKFLSTSVISLISTLIISLVIWLVVVFMSVVTGVESQWIDRLLGIVGAVQLKPTDEYYSSYYHLVDQISEASGYRLKTLEEKMDSDSADPHDSDIDIAPMPYWNKYEDETSGDVLDIVKKTVDILSKTSATKNLEIMPRQSVWANLRLTFKRESYVEKLEQFVLIKSLYRRKVPRRVKNMILKVDDKSLKNLLTTIATVDRENFAKNLRGINVDKVKVTRGEICGEGLLPKEFFWKSCGVFLGDRLVKVIIPPDGNEVNNIKESIDGNGYKGVVGNVRKVGENVFFEDREIEEKIVVLSLEDSLSSTVVDGAMFVNLEVQGVIFERVIDIHKLNIEEISVIDKYKKERLWVSSDNDSFPEEFGALGEPLLLSSSLRNRGADIGDRGVLNYTVNTFSGPQEQSVPVYVAGFYDAGIFPAPVVFVNSSVTIDICSEIFSSLGNDNLHCSDEIVIDVSNVENLESIKDEIVGSISNGNLSRFWSVKTYENSPFAKDIISHIRSEKTLFTFLAIIIIFVSSTNIVSMLILLINDKRKEVAIFRSMGASKKSVVAIFSLCALIIGGVSCLLGSLLAIVTLNNLPEILHFVNKLQGFSLVSPGFYSGQVLPHDLNWEVLEFTTFTACSLSVLAGIIPAMKAASVNPSKILR